MSGGPFFRRERRQWERTQNAQAQRLLVDARKEQAVARLRRSRAEAEQRERQARQEAERRRAEEQQRQQARDAARLARDQRRQAQEAAEALKKQKKLQRDAERLLAQQRENQEREAYNAMTDLLAGLPVLQGRCNSLVPRLNSLIQFLLGSGAAELVVLQADLVRVQAIAAQCPVVRQQVLQLQQQNRLLQDVQAQSFAILHRQNLLQLVITMDQDNSDITVIDATITNTRATYQAALATATSYRNLKLDNTLILAAAGPCQLWTTQQLQRVNSKLDGANVTGWNLCHWPATRGQRPNGWPAQFLLPIVFVTVKNVKTPTGSNDLTLVLQLGPEIIVDWLLETPDHGFSYRELVDKCASILDTKNRLYNLFKPTMAQSPRHHNNWQVLCQNFAFNLILNPGRTMIITYFK